ncbi:hypothetical protein AB0L65_32935 [Nonomuraea sp. NPDC052116]|uniref:hypothetical protein n=1 Tax=Nonomuraea sp. NPDC052116 TaxID=3155665 RepID=UPI003434FBF4
MTPTEIAAQMAALADQLRESLIAPPDDWDFDYAAVTSSVKEATNSLTGVTNLVVEFADGCDTPGWDDVHEAALKAADKLLAAGWSVETLADEVEHAQSAPIGADA